jgi:hypothetical protein
VVAAPSWPPPTGPGLAPGPHLLQVLAFTATDTVGAMEYGVRFVLAPPPPTR